MSPQPDSMGGAHRQHDPSELEHDQARRRWMGVAALVLIPACASTGFGIGQVLALAAGAPLAMAIKLGEMRAKVAREEFQLLVKELPGYKIAELVVWLGLNGAAIFRFPKAWPWLLAGGWLWDALTYYRHRPERMRHLYAVAMAIDFFRDFSLPWVYPLPLLAWALWGGLHS